MKEHGAYSSSEAATYEADRAVEPLWHLENAFVRALLARSVADTVLDAPVGTGRFLDLYEGRAVTGIDLSTSMLDEASKRATSLGLSNVALRQSSVTSLPFADKQFDFVVSWRLFHLLPPDTVVPALTELARVCQGTLCIQTYERAPSLLRLIAKAKRWARRLKLVFSDKRQLTPWSHIRAYTHSREAIEQAAHSAGLGAPATRSFLGDYEGTRVMALVWMLR
ncbi:class I SAM-dependent methyltransferase [Variovorax arabinosiphilus]|uniref:class I SAM-dependent methyltransferase n=1 Tax=Variovorax arabinosiphilus TaxID=3053498 RepID=UPI002578D1DD|nr:MULTISPECIES: class I SAM-dependent methyltransferase [unclassified Variovorax]MDM0121765.1 class I SAM-dependent methyltransferase [Variovorax sp. J2L1-78]MDM0130826.1 class I SAM-dependent methyltransferase [Variovorax sp. J2L1-63]MDM0234528.1 class I SAM-dependent methyltransferase [Variovorax sp. J2R1-6]